MRVVVRALMALLGWFALVLQLVIMLQNSAVPVGDTLINYFSFFTILTNILVALSLSAPWFPPRTRLRRFFSKPHVKAAITVYIAVVGIIYSLLLRKIWNPTGWQLVADRLLHNVMPVLAVLYWLVVEPKGLLQWKHAFWWLIYPALYLGYSLLRGSATGKYPYPFIDYGKLGLQQTATNITLMAVAFLAIGLLFVTIDRLMARRS